MEPWENKYKVLQKCPVAARFFWKLVLANGLRVNSSDVEEECESTETPVVAFWLCAKVPNYFLKMSTPHLARLVRHEDQEIAVGLSEVVSQCSVWLYHLLRLFSNS